MFHFWFLMVLRNQDPEHQKLFLSSAISASRNFGRERESDKGVTEFRNLQRRLAKNPQIVTYTVLKFTFFSKLLPRL